MLYGTLRGRVRLALPHYFNTKEKSLSLEKAGSCPRIQMNKVWPSNFGFNLAAYYKPWPITHSSAQFYCYSAEICIFWPCDMKSNGNKSTLLNFNWPTSCSLNKNRLVAI